MSHLLTLPLLAVALAIPWFGKLASLRPKPRPEKVVLDSLPPAWQPASLLSLQNEFVRPSLPPIRRFYVGLQLREDPRRLRMRIDADSSALRVSNELGEVPLGPAFQIPLAEFARQQPGDAFLRQWQKSNRDRLNSLGAFTPAVPTAGSGFRFSLPSPLPKRVQSFLGPGGPALTLNGTENIRLSGRSNWTNQQVGPLGRKQSLFPSLDMQQDLDIRLEGQLSDRVKVNLLQNSGISIPLANRIAINYKGDEDDLVQALDLGNTNLTLPGTQYVSYSGRNEGLFGAKATTRVGPLDFTLLASKQEGRSERASYAGGASSQNSTVHDVDWVKGQFFFLSDPNDSTLVPLYVPLDSIAVYVDDFNAFNDVATNVRRGRAYADRDSMPSDTASAISVRGSFTLLNYGADLDYEINTGFYGPDFPVLKLNRSVDGNQVLAVSYYAYPIVGRDPSLRPILGPRFQVGGTLVQESDTDTTTVLRLQLLRPPRDRLSEIDSGELRGMYDTSNVFVRLRELELKNVYQLPGQRIEKSTFKLTIRRGRDDPPVISFRTPATGDTSISYLEAIGLDNYDESTGQLIEGHDGRLDGTLPTQQNRLFVDFESGLLLFYDLRPFAPRLDKRFERVLDGILFRRARLDGPPDSLNAANANAYDKYLVQRDNDSRYFMEVEFSAQRATGEISLGRTNILDGSEKVLVNGVEWVRGRDYEIDYDLGRLTLKKQLGATENLSVNYSYAPLFQQAGRTLIGSAFKLEGRDKMLGGAFMYESKGAQDLRPRLGEEPSRSLIGDLNTDWTFRPSWVTRLVDALPGVRTTTPSEFRMQAEVGASYPNPNTRNEVYVDDMEGVRDAVSLTMDRGRWRYASPPTVPGINQTINDLPGRMLGELHWYSPASSVSEVDLKPNLTEAQGAKNRRLVLAMSVPRRPLTSSSSDTLWTGLTYVLDQQGLDLSRAQFIELWVNDWADFHEGVRVPRVRGRNVRLHVDLGAVSEDQQRAPNRLPNAALDTEDKGETPDGQLTVTGPNAEDTGYDGVLADTAVFVAGGSPPDPRNADLSTASPEDPAGDNFQTIRDTPNKEDIDPRRYVFVNGTEDNHNLDPLPDTEDLNLNGTLESREDLFRYTIDLGDSTHPYLITDVQREFPPSEYPEVKADNGWRRYRIPITDSLRTKIGNPNLAIARHVRVWLDGIVDPDPANVAIVKPLVLLGGLEIVGSRWQVVALSDTQSTLGTTLTLNSVNSVDNAEDYVPPFDPGRTRSGSQELLRREQSVAMEFTRLQPEDTLEAYKTFSVDENYSRYGVLNWYAAGFDVPNYLAGTDTLFYFVRFASDEQGRNYYEYKAPLPPSSSPRSIQWSEVKLDLTELSNLKLRTDFPQSGEILYRAAGPGANDSLIVKGRPSFTRLRRVSFGLINPSATREFDSGQLWFDELRATDVAKDRGVAQRVLMSGRFANLAHYNVTWDGRSADFISVGQSRGSGVGNENLNFSGGFEPHRFFDGSGISVPLGFSYSRGTQQPRFSAGDDVVRVGALADASRSVSESRGFTTSYSRNWSDRANPFLRYTLGGISAGYTRNESESTSPSGASNSKNSSTSVSYGIAPRSLLRIALPLVNARFYPLPERFTIGYASASTESRTFTRSADGTQLFLQSAPRGRTTTVSIASDTRPLDFLHHHIDALRNLELPDAVSDRPSGINLGRVVSWRQSWDASFNLGKNEWLSPRVTTNSSYIQDNRPELSVRRDLSVKAINNAQAVTLNWSLPFDKLARPSAGGTTEIKRGIGFVPPRNPAAIVDSAAAVPDTAAKAAAPAKPRFAPDWRAFAWRIGRVSADASFDRNSSFTRLVGIPGPAYLFGLSDNPGLESDSTGRMREEFGNVASFGSSWRASARTRIVLVMDASINTQLEFTGRRNESSRVTTRTLTSRYPNLEFNYGRLAQALRLQRFVSNPQLRSSYQRSTTKDYRNSQTVPTGTATSSQWQPLLSLDGDLKNQTRVSFKVERRVTQRENFQNGRSRTTDRNTIFNLNLSRSYSKGQKVKFLNRESTVKTAVTLSLAASYDKQSGETIKVDVPGSRPQLPTDRDRLSINGTGTYSFSTNVNGSVRLGFGQNRDNKADRINRNVDVQIGASFTF